MTYANSNGMLTQEKCPACGQNGAMRFLQAPDRYHGRRDLYQLLRCPSCSLVWLDNPPRPDEMGTHYGVDYDRSVAAAGEDPSRWRDRCETLLRYKNGGAILDLGCSSGGFLASLKGPSWRRYGIEMSTQVAEIAKEKCGADVFVGDILDAPYPPATFDAITCFHVFEHLYQPREILTKVSGWLKPGGIFYTLVPNIDSAAARVFGTYWYALELPRHLFHFSPASLSYLAKSAGLEVAHLETQREVFVEKSSSYLLDDIFQKFGVQRVSLSKAKPASLPFKVVRKAFRLIALPLVDAAIGLVGDKESIHAVFRK